MSNVVNLRMARKQKARSDKEKTAAENRVLHGMSKSERQRNRAEADKALDFIEAHRLERTDGLKR